MTKIDSAIDADPPIIGDRAQLRQDTVVAAHRENPLWWSPDWLRCPVGRFNRDFGA